MASGGFFKVVWSFSSLSRDVQLARRIRNCQPNFITWRNSHKRTKTNQLIPDGFFLTTHACLFVQNSFATWFLNINIAYVMEDKFRSLHIVWKFNFNVIKLCLAFIYF